MVMYNTNFYLFQHKELEHGDEFYIVYKKNNEELSKYNVYNSC